MADIGLVIKIPEKNYEHIKEQVDKRDYPDMLIGRAIANGTPLTISEDGTLTVAVGEVAIKALDECKVGKWVKNEHTFWTCSECGWVNKYNRERYAYCPNCGAKIDKE